MQLVYRMLKNIIFLSAEVRSLLISALSVDAQSDFPDEVYPANGDKPFPDFRILTPKTEN